MHSGEPQNPHDDRTLRVFWLGQKIHEALQDTFPFVVIGHELSLKNEEYKLSGRIDTLAEVDGLREVIEFKSVNSKKFSYGTLPDQHHILQLGCYLTFPLECPSRGAHQSRSNGIELIPDEARCESCKEKWADPAGKMPLPDRGRLIYWSKDDARIEEYVVTPSEELSNAVKEELVRLESLYQAYKSTGSLPSPLPAEIRLVRGKEVEAEDWRVRYCSYRGTGKCCGDAPRSGDAVDVGADNPSE